MSALTPIPLFLQCWCTAWQLDAALSRQFWQALYHARWSTAASFRQSLAYLDTVPDSAAKLDVVRAMTDTITPPQMVDVLEALVGETRLSRKTASQIEEAILTHTDATGEWRL